MSGKQVIKFLCPMKYAVGREVFFPQIREDLIEENKIFQGDFILEYKNFVIYMQDTD